MDLQVIHYSSLTKNQLYQLLYLRIKIFVVEQNCPYQELDDLDKISYHVLGTIDQTLISIGRIVPNEKEKQILIGRIAVNDNHRKNGYALKMMNEIIYFINTNFSNFEIALSAQTYLKEFYISLGFKAHGETYLEDGIPHIYMIKNN